MPLKRRQRLILVLLIVSGVSIALALILFSLKQNINFFFNPTQVEQGKAPQRHVFRLGGLVEKGSLHWDKADGEISFSVTDLEHAITVHYHGVLPDLFQEGRGVVAQGKLNTQGIFVADELLAKHDNKYSPVLAKK